MTVASVDVFAAGPLGVARALERPHENIYDPKTHSPTVPDSATASSSSSSLDRKKVTDGGDARHT
jgi:hypothetical protein